MRSRKLEPIHFPQAKIMNECAPGALVSYGDLSLVIANTSAWEKNIGLPISDVPQRLKSLLSRRYECLDSTHFRHLKTDKASSFGKEEIKVPGVLFPTWMYCTNCGLMLRLPWLSEDLKSIPLQKRFPLECEECKKKGKKARMAFIPYVLVHEGGSLDDLPWSYLCHQGAESEEQKNCKHYDRLYLIRDSKGKEVIRCGYCNSQRTTASILQHEAFSKGVIDRMNPQPWLKTSPVEVDTPIATDLSDGRIHIPIVVSAIDIPPESRKDPNDVDSKVRALEDYERIKSYDKSNPSRFLHEIKKLSRILGFPLSSIESIFTGDGSSKEIKDCHSQQDIFVAEYNALITPLKEISPNERFIPTHRTEAWKDISNKPDKAECKIIERLVTLERLREVQVYCGFNRGSDQGKLIPPDAKGWQPGCELWGEGLFFSLDTEVLQQWEEMTSVLERVSVLNQRLLNSELKYRATNLMMEEDGNIIPRFVLLHTLTHLIARELEFHCGYPISSIKERIYATSSANGNAAGALLYVAAADEYGTLGGLIECSHEIPFSNILSDALQKAQRCSLDPVCAKHLGQGPDLLNLAACHNCCLIPETSCQFGNLFLDRQLLVNEDFGLLAFMDLL